MDLDHLSCEHHEAMLSALAFLPIRDEQIANLTNTPMKLAVLGLGGGALTAYLYRQLPQVSIH